MTRMLATTLGVVFLLLGGNAGAQECLTCWSQKCPGMKSYLKACPAKARKASSQSESWDRVDAAALERNLARFAPVDLSVDLGSLPQSEQKALARLIEASQQIDAIFLEQAYAGNADLLTRLAQDTSRLGRAQLHAFLINKGPWSRLDGNAAFVPGVGDRPAQGNFYPADATKAEVESWFKSLSGEAQKQATGFYSVIRRDPDGKLVSVPFSVAYQNALELAAQKLEAAARLTQNTSLQRFLLARAKSFGDNDYYPSELAWMELDSAIDPTIGPYEVYEDEWFNDKAAFESFINLRDEKESQKLQHLSAELQEIENHLPIADGLKNPKLGESAPIRVVDELYCSGNASIGVQTAAYNLPNDERITTEKGTKRVMLKNVQEAKFKKVLLPIARIALSPKDQKNVSFDAFFTHILMHELMHGLGPHEIVVNGRKTTVREELQAADSPLEEAKADVAGLFAMQYLVDKGVLDKSFEKTMYTTFLASSLRSIRFGLAEAHGKGIALQINYYLDHGGFALSHGRLTVVPGKIAEAVKSLTHDLMTVQGEGDRAGAEKMLATLGVVRPPIQHILDQLNRVPVDIEPRFVTAQKLLAKYGER